MATNLALRCVCGEVRGTVACEPNDRRIVCYCSDCQAFAHALGRADDILSAQGGTDILQLSPARLWIEVGRDKLACLQLKPKSLLRWHTSCCNTPIGNTLPASWAAFVGLITVCVADRSALDALFGSEPPGVFAKDALGDRAQLTGAADGMPPLRMLRALTTILGRRVRGEHRRSPFVDPSGGKLIVTPRVLSPEARAALGR